MNIKGPKGRGGYSAVVYKDNSLYVAEDEVGNLIIESTDAATVIQKAIDDYAYTGFVLVEPDMTLSSTLILKGWWNNIEFRGLIKTATTIPAFQLGTAATALEYSRLKFTQLDGQDKSAQGIIFENCSCNVIEFLAISNCSIGLYFDADVDKDANENRITGEMITQCGTACIRFASNSGYMEGNHFNVNSFNSPVLFETQAGGNCKFQTYMGAMGGIGTQEDIKDAVGENMFFTDFVRRWTCTLPDSSLVFNMYSGHESGDAIAFPNGIIDFANIGLAPILFWDFNRDSTGDWTKEHVTMDTPSKSITRLTTSGVWAEYITRDINIDGGQTQIIVIRYKYISGTKTDGKIYYTTAGHGHSEDYYKKTRNYICDGKWHVELLDMSDLNAGGTDWIDNTITGIRWDIVSTGVEVVMDIDYIGILGKGHPSAYNLDDALLTPATASAQGNKGDIRWDASYIYICTATDTWKRVAISTW